MCYNGQICLSYECLECVNVYLSTSSISFITSIPVSIVPIASVSIGSEANCKLPTASSREFSSWKDNLIETRTRMIVGVIP